MRKGKRVQGRGGENVDLEWEVLSGGRAVRFYFEGPGGTGGEKITHTVTLGAEDSAGVELDTLAKVQGKVDQEAQNLADRIESQRKVAALLGQVV